jgi:hypothetical protein
MPRKFIILTKDRKSNRRNDGITYVMLKSSPDVIRMIKSEKKYDWWDI